SKLARLGLSAAKIRALKEIARAVASERLALASLAAIEAEAAHAALTAVHGIGPWTADIYLLSCLGHADARPAGDSAPAEAAGPAIWRCKKRRGLRLRCRSGRVPRRWSRSPKCGGRCARWRRACCGPTIVPSKAATRRLFRPRRRPCRSFRPNESATNAAAAN